jgi:hypothetical protein
MGRQEFLAAYFLDRNQAAHAIGIHVPAHGPRAVMQRIPSQARWPPIAAWSFCLWH